MKALQVTSDRTIEIVEATQPTPSRRQALIKINAAALNRRDQWIREGKYPKIKFNTTLGSDACGEVVALGENNDEDWLGKKVIINPNVGWGNDPLVQSSYYKVLGMPIDGTLAEYIAIDNDRLVEKPTLLTDEQAAAIPLGGLTSYRAVFHHGKIKPSDNILISGFGGGVAQFAFQLATAAGAKVYVTTGNQANIDLAIQMGATNGFNYSDDNFYKKALEESNGFDIVIDSAGGDQVNTFIKMMKPGGRIIIYGATNGTPANLDLYRMFWNQITLQGTTMGNDAEFIELVNFIEKHKIVPIVDSVRPFDDVISAFNQMKTGNRVGKLVVKME